MKYIFILFFAVISILIFIIACDNLISHASLIKRSKIYGIYKSMDLELSYGYLLGFFFWVGWAIYDFSKEPTFSSFRGAPVHSYVWGFTSILMSLYCLLSSFKKKHK